MEDRAICVPDLLDLHGAPLSYYAVFDGHEGAAAAELASTQLHATLANRLRSLPQCGAPHFTMPPRLVALPAHALCTSHG